MQITNGTRRWLALAIGGATLTSGGVALAATAGSSTTPPAAAVPAPSATTPRPLVSTPADPSETGATDATEATDTTESSASEAADMAKLKALAKIDEAQAKTTALAKVRGTAGVTELSDENGKPVWDVEVTATDGTMHDVTVDAVTGTIVTSETND